tara:strand:+ start:309 stop:2279 length:1971 start_codon:yes stop_codon:yes gene_type:complete
MLVDVLLPLNFDHSFTYQSDKKLKIGNLVLVSFKNKEIVGVVWDLKPRPLRKNVKIKKIIEIFNLPSLSKNKISFIEKMSIYNLVNKGMVLNLFLYKKGFSSFNKGLKKIINFREFIPRTDQKEELNNEQKNILKCIKKNISFNHYSTNLLQGIPGSGKTHVYFEIIKKALKEGFQVLVLLPEKGLSEQIAKRFRNFFKYEPAIWHSGVKDKVKKKIWKGIFKNQIKLVLGARSALFLPFQKLKLIIIDEEHDSSYKQDEGLPFSARDMAILEASIEKFPVFLVSATPSVETFHNAQNKKYNYYCLQNRYNESDIPEIQTIKLQKKNTLENNFISELVTKEVKSYLQTGDQVLFFLNRRGHSTFLFCYNCMKRLECPRCSVGLVYHKKNNVAICHYCNYVAKLRRECRNDQICKFNFYGVGLEKIYEEIKIKFKGYSTDILSSDLTDYNKFQPQLQNIENNKTKIIVATQIVSKGFNFKNLNCIVAVNCDSAFLGNDIRASEKNYQMLYQLAGRAGRFNSKSKIFLQTFDDQNSIFNSLKKFNSIDFYKNEIDFRKQSKLPPFYKFISIIVSGKNNFQAQKYAVLIKNALPRNENIELYGPVSAAISKIKYDYRFRLLIKYNPKVTPQTQIKKKLNVLQLPNSLKLQIDVDPINFY